LVVNPYAQELAECIDFVDKVLPWENKKHKLNDIIKFSKELRNKKFDLCVIFNPSKEFNIISFLAGVPLRLGYNRKWGILLNRKTEDRKNLGKKHEIEYNLELAGLIGAETGNKTLFLRIDDDIINGLFRDYGIENSKNLMAIHPWTSDPVKQWPIEKFSELAKRVAGEFGFKVLIIGGKEEFYKSQEFFSGLNNIVNLTGKTSLKQLAALLKICKLLISGDSGPVHLASCVDTTVIAIFRNDLPGKTAVRWGPRSSHSIVIEKNNLSDISVDEVFDKVKEALKR